MNIEYIKKRAIKFTDRFIKEVQPHDEVILEAQSEIKNIDNPLDKVHFLRIILEGNEIERQKHLKTTCTQKEDCPVDYDHESIAYFLIQELNKLGIKTNNDQFTIEEKNIIEVNLEQILNDLQVLKDGQRIIYEDFTQEISDLRDLYILGKKTWHQLLYRKLSEMVTSGVISETVSKQIVETLKQTLSLT